MTSGIYASAVPLGRMGIQFADAVDNKIGKLHITGQIVGDTAATLMITDGQTLKDHGAVQTDAETLKLMQFDPFN